MFCPCYLRIVKFGQISKTTIPLFKIFLLLTVTAGEILKTLIYKLYNVKMYLSHWYQSNPKVFFLQYALSAQLPGLAGLSLYRGSVKQTKRE